jgi:hypothetical protein
MTISFYLTRPQSKTLTSIFGPMRYYGTKMRFYIPEIINRKFWNQDIHRAKQSSKFREQPQLITRLNNIDEKRLNNFFAIKGFLAKKKFLYI